MNITTQLSVVICTYNRAGFLKKCLASLKEQTASKETYEVIIVDNNSVDATPEVARNFQACNLIIRYIFEPHQGLSYARNRGFAEANSDWVMYIDDDAIAFADCIEQVLFALKKYDADCIGGVFYPVFESTKPAWFDENIETNCFQNEKTGPMPDGRAAFGGIMIIKKKILEKLGGFCTDLGMKGSKRVYEEETEFQDRLRKLGGKIYHVKEIQVYHIIAPFRLKVWFQLKLRYYKARDLCIREKMSPMPSWLFLRHILFILRSILPKSLILLITTKDYYWQNFILDCVGPVMTYAGRQTGAKQKITLPKEEK